MVKMRKVHAIIILGILLRVIFWSTAPVTGDGSFHFPIAKYMAETGKIPIFEHLTGPNPFWYPPLFHILTAAIYMISGVLTLSPLIFGSTGLIAYYLFCKRFYPRYADMATAILALLPFHIYYSGIGYVESLTFLLAVIGYDLYLQYLKTKNDGDMAYAGIGLGLCALTHYHGAIPLATASLDLFTKNRKKALALLAIGLLVAGPWYLRNYIVFGNPVWPKLSPGFFPNDETVQSMPPLKELLSLSKPWMLFHDFWIGAPNSGDSIASNLSRLGQFLGKYAPITYIGYMIWFLAAAYLTVHALSSFIGSLKKGGSLSGTNLALFALTLSIIPFLGNSLGRMFVAAIPFLPIAIAKSMNGGSRTQNIMIVTSILILVCASFGYALIYRIERQKYEPFWQTMNRMISPDDFVLMPFTQAECTYETGLTCVRVGSTKGVQKPQRPEDVMGILEEYGIDWVCCSSLGQSGYSKDDMMLCDQFRGFTPDIHHEKDGIWGSCWKLG